MEALRRRLTQEHYNMEELSAIRTFLRLVCTKENLGSSERMYKVRCGLPLYDWCVLYLASQVTDLCDKESECFRERL